MKCHDETSMWRGRFDGASERGSFYVGATPASSVESRLMLPDEACLALQNARCHRWCSTRAKCTPRGHKPEYDPWRISHHAAKSEFKLCTPHTLHRSSVYIECTFAEFCESRALAGCYDRRRHRSCEILRGTRHRSASTPTCGIRSFGHASTSPVPHVRFELGGQARVFIFFNSCDS
jgi:hypothetical protein